MNMSLKSAFVKITVHYIVIIGLVTLIVRFFPGFLDYLPVGTAAQLFTYEAGFEIETSAYAGKFAGESNFSLGLFFFICFLTSLIVAVPLGTSYLATRPLKAKTTSLVKMIVILPVAVTGLVLIVQNSLALAFSLAGIVAGAGIRFRTNMREFTDTLFFLVSIAIGLAAGVGALGLSLIMSGFFCYTFLIFHAIGYGDFNGDLPSDTEE